MRGAAVDVGEVAVCKLQVADLLGDEQVECAQARSKAFTAAAVLGDGRECEGCNECLEASHRCQDSVPASQRTNHSDVGSHQGSLAKLQIYRCSLRMFSFYSKFPSSQLALFHCWHPDHLRNQLDTPVRHALGRFQAADKQGSGTQPPTSAQITAGIEPSLSHQHSPWYYPTVNLYLYLSTTGYELFNLSRYSHLSTTHHHSLVITTTTVAIHLFPEE